MDFSSLHEISKGKIETCNWSPNGQYLAHVNNTSVVVRSASSLEITNVFHCLDSIDYLEFSPDSQYILCCEYKRHTVEIFCIEKKVEEWKGIIDEAMSGLVRAFWAPDSRHICTLSDFSLRLTIWSLSSSEVMFIKFPKFTHAGIKFSPNEKFLAVGIRRDGKDYVHIYTTSPWQMVSHFVVTTSDFEDFVWSPDSTSLALYDHVTDFFFTIYTIEGTELCQYRAPESYTLGVSTLAWKASGFFIVGGFDQTLRIFNDLTWRPVLTADHPIEVDPAQLVIYKEQAIKPELRPERGSIMIPQKKRAITKFFIIETDLYPISADANVNANVKVGVSAVHWAHSCHFFFSKNDTMPHHLWIWDITQLSCIVLIETLHPIVAAAWCPSMTTNKLVFCTGNDNLYVWTEQGSSIIKLPPIQKAKSFLIRNILWNPSGNSLLLLDKNNFCVCYHL